MFITKKKHEEIVFKKSDTILELSRTIDDQADDIRRITEELEEFKQAKIDSQSKLNNYLIVIGPDSQIDVKGHYFELDDGALSVYRYGATGKEIVFHCNKFQYITICE